MQRRVDREPEDRDDAEEAVEDEQEERDEDQADDRGVARLAERVLAERRGDVGALDRDELDGQRAGLEHEREVLRLLLRRDAGDLGAGRRSGRSRRRTARSRSTGTSRSGCRGRSRSSAACRALPALRLVPGDLVEELVALAGELHRHDRLAGGRVDVGLRAGELQLLAGHLRERARRVERVDAVLEEVVVGDARRPGALESPGQTTANWRVARDDDRPVRRRQHLVAGREAGASSCRA